MRQSIISSLVRCAIFPLVFVFIVDTQALQCRSYGKQLGECVEITKCPRLLAILISNDRTIHDLRMLQKLTCITEISDLQGEPIVCCPLSEISDFLSNNSNLPPELVEENHSEVNNVTKSPQSTTSTTKPVSVTTTASTTTTSGTPLESTSKYPPTSVPYDLLKSKFSLIPPLSQCSVSYVTNRIIGGQRVSHGTYPWMARLGYRHKRTGQLAYYCGGSIINKRYVLTAGHCAQGFDDSFVLTEVRLGEHDASIGLDCNPELNGLCSLPEDFKIEKVVTHPQHNTATKQNDIALLRLNRDISFNSFFIGPVCLPFLNEYGLETPTLKNFEKNNVTVAGWGRQFWNKTQGSTQLMHVTIPLVSNEKCQRLYRRRVSITSMQLCAGGVRNKDSCAGDSGGPLMATVRIPNKLPKSFQFGIVSFGQIQCGGLLPGVYTRVSEYLPWILQNIEK